MTPEAFLMTNSWLFANKVIRGSKFCEKSIGRVQIIFGDVRPMQRGIAFGLRPDE